MACLQTPSDKANDSKKNMFLAFYNPPFFRISLRYFLPRRRESLEVKGLTEDKKKMRA